MVLVEKDEKGWKKDEKRMNKDEKRMNKGWKKDEKKDEKGSFITFHHVSLEFSIGFPMASHGFYPDVLSHPSARPCLRLGHCGPPRSLPGITPRCGFRGAKKGMPVALWPWDSDRFCEHSLNFRVKQQVMTDHFCPELHLWQWHAVTW